MEFDFGKTVTVHPRCLTKALSMTIDSTFIEHWEPEYDKIASDETEYLSLIERVNQETKIYKSIPPETLERIINWKSPRTKGYIKWTNYDIYRNAFRETLDPRNPVNMSLLVSLPGIGAPVASTILHFFFPDVYPIYDFRTVEVLNSFGYLKNKTVNLSRYPEFQKVIQEIRTALLHYNLRQIDRALFAYHKINFRKTRKCTPNNKKTPNSKWVNAKRMGDPRSIPEIVKLICRDLGRDGKEIRRKDIIAKAKKHGINESSVLPADYCDNTKTGQWCKHSFLHSIGPGRYILSSLNS